MSQNAHEYEHSFFSSRDYSLDRSVCGGLLSTRGDRGAGWDYGRKHEGIGKGTQGPSCCDHELATE